MKTQTVFLVTIKLPSQVGHNPRSKVTAACPVSPHCTDMTGEHHTLIAYTEAEVEQIREHHHITRVETAALSRAAAPEPEWEYGLHTRSKSDPERDFFSYASDLETAQAMYEATRKDCTAVLMRRRKAGPWEQLPEGG